MDPVMLEHRRIQREYAGSLARLRRLMKNDDEVRELVLRLLVSPSLGDMLGYLIPTGYGYMQSTESVLSRMGLVVSLVSHGILDDGDPGIGWVRYGILVDSDEL